MHTNTQSSNVTAVYTNTQVNSFTPNKIQHKDTKWQTGGLRNETRMEVITREVPLVATWGI